MVQWINDKKGITNLANKNFKAAKTRNIISIIAIILTTLLFTSVFTLGVGVVEQIEFNTMHQVGSSAHGIIKFLTQQEYEIIKDHSLIEEIGYEKVIGEIENEELMKQTTFISGADKNTIKMNFAEPLKGSVPITEDEILVDNQTLQLLGIPLEIGSNVPLKFSVEGIEYEKEFILSGYYVRDPRLAVVGIYCSPLFAENFWNNQITSDEFIENGTINARIMFRNKKNITENLQTIITDSGYSIDENSRDYIEYNNNWAYIQIDNNINPLVILSLFFIILIIMLVGYLIIYNVFQISVIQDIRLYGLLKTIGMTYKQIQKILLRQVLMLTFIGIPIGLILGYFVGVALIPFFMKGSTVSYEGMNQNITANPLIFIAASLFSFITVIISVRKPNKIASSVSPIEALRFYNIEVRTAKRSNGKGIKIHQMSRKNMMRNKKQVILTVMSLSLSLILLNCVSTIAQSFNMEKYLSRYTNADFVIAHAKYFQFEYKPEDHFVSEDVIFTIENIDGYIEGVKIYNGSKDDISNVYYVNETGENQEFEYNEVDIYGTDKKALEKFALLDGKLDISKLNSGNYVLEPIVANDEGIATMSEAQYEVGDKVKLYYYNDADRLCFYKEVEVIGHIQLNWFTDTKRYFSGQMFYVSTEGIKHLVENPAIMSYSFNIKDGEKNKVERWIKNYTSYEKDSLKYESEEIYKDKFKNLTEMIDIIGIISSTVIGFIGIMNFINCMLTGIITRKREFAMMQSIGMTKKQLISMLSIEGFYYAMMTIIFSLSFSTIVSLLIIRNFSKQIWFMSYNFTVLPIIICALPLVLFGAIVPIIIFKSSNKQSIIERLQLIE